MIRILKISVRETQLTWTVSTLLGQDGLGAPENVNRKESGDVQCLRSAALLWWGWREAVTLTGAGAETFTLSGRGRSWAGRPRWQSMKDHPCYYHDHARFRCGETGHFTPSGAGGAPALTSVSPPGPSPANTPQFAVKSRWIKSITSQNSWQASSIYWLFLRWRRRPTATPLAPSARPGTRQGAPWRLVRVTGCSKPQSRSRAKTKTSAVRVLSMQWTEIKWARETR